MVKIDTSTEVIGLIGDPVEGSLSPRLQNWAIDRLDLDYRYFAFPVKKGTVEEAIVGANSLGIKGLNVTAPHKKVAAKKMDELSGAAKSLGAVNTITFTDEGKLKGYNTDWKGFVNSLKLTGFEPRGKRCLVFGAGGAAAAVVFGLIREAPSRIVIVNRTEAKAAKLAREMEGLSPGVDLEVRPLSGTDIGKKIERSDLVVNATSVGTGSTEAETIWKTDSNFNPDQLVYDLIYNPDPTEFLKLARNAGSKTVSGLDMLILQGLESLKVWTEEEFNPGPMVDELRDHLRQQVG
ncbi:MAG: shikimate dehydrogenase [Candidatus Bipolaricaulia bacterium]